MRAILFALLVTAGVGFVGTSSVSAAPAFGGPIGEALGTTSDVSTVQWRRRHHRRHVGPRCRTRCNAWGRCWRVCRW